MAIDNIQAYSHLSDDDIADIGKRLDAIKLEVTESLGERDVAYIRRLIRVQRALEVAGRISLMFAGNKKCWWAGTAFLSTAKILENLEIGHNVLHGQWDWMNDPEIHSTTWEWDIVCPSSQWMHSHNYVHHTYTNVLGMDHDVGYGVLRVTRDRQWTPLHAFQPVINLCLPRCSNGPWDTTMLNLESSFPSGPTGMKPKESSGRPPLKLPGKYHETISYTQH